MISIIIAIIIFSLIIIFHEFGHFIVAKKNDVRVEEFCLGLGPTLFGVTKGETKYCLKLLPFGGACIMTGEDEDSDDDRAFCNKTVWQRIAIVFAGPFFNFILAFILALILIGFIGYDLPQVYVSEGSAAAGAGLEDGDIIKSIDGTGIHVYREISNYLVLHPSKVTSTLTVVYERNGEEYTAQVTPQYSEEAGRYLFGVTSYERTRGNVISVVGYSLYEVKYWIDLTLNSLRLIFTGGVSLNDVSGPVGIVSTISTTYNESVSVSYFAAFINMINIAILLTANLGVMNLLPIPALDGGRLLIFIIELIRRKKMNPDHEGMINFVGLIVLLGLMVVIMAHDIYKLF